MKHSYKKLPFLDILTKNENGQINIDISHKPTHIQQYLHFNSHHPKNCIKSIPYITLARRICSIITNKTSEKLAVKNYIQS